MKATESGVREPYPIFAHNAAVWVPRDIDFLSEGRIARIVDNQQFPFVTVKCLATKAGKGAAEMVITRVMSTDDGREVNAHSAGE